MERLKWENVRKQLHALKRWIVKSENVDDENSRDWAADNTEQQRNGETTTEVQQYSIAYSDYHYILILCAYPLFMGIKRKIMFLIVRAWYTLPTARQRVYREILHIGIG